MISMKARWLSALAGLFLMSAAACNGGESNGTGGTGGATTTSMSTDTGGTGGDTGTTTVPYVSQDPIAFAKCDLSKGVHAFGLQKSDPQQGLGMAIKIVPKDLPYWLEQLQYSILTGSGPSGTYNCVDGDFTIAFFTAEDGSDTQAFKVTGQGIKKTLINRLYTFASALQIPKDKAYGFLAIHWVRGPNDESLCLCVVDPKKPDPFDGLVYVTTDAASPYMYNPYIQYSPTFAVDDAPDGYMPPAPPPLPVSVRGVKQSNGAFAQMLKDLKPMSWALNSPVWYGNANGSQPN